MANRKAAKRKAPAGVLMPGDSVSEATRHRLAFFVSGAPVPKARPRVGRAWGGGQVIYTPQTTVDYEARVRQVARLAVIKAKKAWDVLHPVVVHLTFHVEPPKGWSNRRRALGYGYGVPVKPDLDNLMKAVMDGMNGVAFVDDARVVGVYAMKLYGTIAEHSGCDVAIVRYSLPDWMVPPAPKGKGARR